MMRWAYAAVVLLAMAFTVLASAPVRDAVEEAMPFTVVDRTITDEGISLTLQMDPPTWSTVGTDDNPVQISEYMLAGEMREEGYPVVPVTSAMFRLPPQGGATVEIVDAEYETLTGIDYAAFFGGDLPEDLGPSAHPTDSWFPGTLAEIGDPAIMCNFRVANLVTYPVQVNTARREVRVYSNIQVNITFNNDDNRNTLPNWPTAISETFLPYYRMFLDWDEDELDEYTLYRGNVQVIMKDNDQLWDEMADWIEWKRQKGWTLEFLTDSDVAWNTNSIKSELQSRWNNAETKFDYIVIIGDDGGSWGVPPGSGGGYGAGDNNYACLAGNDDMPEVAVGRISIESSTHAATYVNKVLAYERDPDLENTDWYLQGCVAVASASSGYETVMLGRYQRHMMLDIGYTQVDTTWVSPWGNGNVHGNAIAAFNNGISFYGCRGYLGAGLNTTEIGNLNNAFMTPVCVDVTCGTGNWSGGYGINEAYMRAGTPNSPKGGIGAMGTATSSTKPRFNNLCSTSSAFSMFVVRSPEMGNMVWSAKYFMFVNYHGFDGDYANFMTWYNLMGDPTVWVYTAIPRELTVDAVDQIELGTNSYTVSVEDENGPLEGAWVTFYKVDDNEDVVVTGVTDASGMITLDTPVRYSGDAMLTVTSQNCAPYRLPVDVVSPDARVGFTDITYIDDGSFGTDGNGNGIPEAGETVGLEIQARNHGTDTETNIVFTGQSDEPWINQITGQVSFTQLDAGETATGTGVILVEIAPEAQHDWIMHIDLEVNSDQGLYNDVAALTVNAPMFAVVDVDPDGELEPGVEREVNIEIRNVGGSDAAASTGTLTSNDPYLQITQGESPFPDIAVDDTGIGTFNVIMHAEGVPGYIATLRLVVESETGQVDTLAVPVVLGSRESTDPIGPDSYGYYAFDNTDVAYTDYVPEYDWIEINPNAGGNDYEGTNLGIVDTADDDDEADVFDLPFPIQYYGETFTEITVCSNGWVAMGDESDLPFARNFRIPTPYGPDNMIAPYWDERRTTGGGAIFSYYDEAGGRFIVEWYQVKDWQNSNPCTFEVIFYDQTVRPTYSGDNDILFQYNTMNHSSGYHYGTSADVYWWTTGIQNATHTDGVLVAYFNSLMPGAATITQGRSILFSTNVALITGVIDGLVTDLATGEPVVGATVHTPDNLYSAVTNDEGYYLMDEVVIGAHELMLNVDCYNDVFIEGVNVEEDDTTRVDIELTHPEITLDPMYIEEQLLPENEVALSVSVMNPGNGPLRYNARITFQGPVDPETNPFRGPVRQLDDPDPNVESVFGVPLETFESRYRGLVFDGQYFWISGSNNYDQAGPNMIYQYDRYGTLVETYEQPVDQESRSAQGFYDLTWDGTYYYGVDDGVLYEMEYSEEDGFSTVSALDVPANPARYLCYDPDEDLFWMGDYGSEIRAINRDGDIVYEYGQEFFPRGLAWYGDDPQGYTLYFICKETGEDALNMIKMNPENGETMLVQQFPDETSSLIPGGGTLSAEWNPLIQAYATVIDGGAHDGLRVFSIADNVQYFEVANPEGELEAEDADTINVTLRSLDLPPDTYHVFLRFDNDACQEQTNYVEFVMIIPDTTNAVGDNIAGVPLEWKFDGVYPNPFNPVTRISFTLQSATNVKARVFNMLGQEIALLADQPMNAGYHSLSFDGTNLASGLYFLSFEAGPLREVRKLVLMK